MKKNNTLKITLISLITLITLIICQYHYKVFYINLDKKKY